MDAVRLWGWWRGCVPVEPHKHVCQRAHQPQARQLVLHRVLALATAESAEHKQDLHLVLRGRTKDNDNNDGGVPGRGIRSFSCPLGSQPRFCALLACRSVDLLFQRPTIFHATKTDTCKEEAFACEWTERRAGGEEAGVLPKSLP